MEHKMQVEDYTSLHADVKAVMSQDVHVGRVLGAMLLYLAHAHGLDPAQIEADAAAQARASKRAQEDKDAQALADVLVEVRALEDKETLTHAQMAARKIKREQEDKDAQAAADALVATRAQEDAAIAATLVPDASAKEPLVKPDPYAQSHKSKPFMKEEYPHAN
jgi:hypothetical protein